VTERTTSLDIEGRLYPATVKHPDLIKKAFLPSADLPVMLEEPYPTLDEGLLHSTVQEIQLLMFGFSLQIM
jgi:hypothetical protein